VQIILYLYLMKTSLFLSLDTRRAKKDGSYPLILRLAHQGKTTSISLGLSFESKYWDSKNRKIRKTYKGVSSTSHLNNMIYKKLAEGNDILNKLSETGQLDFLSIKEIKGKITKASCYESFFGFSEKLIEQLRASKRFGTATSYKGTLSVLRTFTGGKDVKFNQVNLDFLQRFEVFHLSKKGNSYNGLAVYLRTIRAIYNKGIKAKIVDRDSYPFYDYKIKQEPTEKRAIDKESLKRIMNFDLGEDGVLFHARNYFILSYMLYGISFADFAGLRRTNIVGDRITYKRRKTGKIYDIQITPQISTLLDLYLNKPSRIEDFIFPIIYRKSKEAQHKDVVNARKYYNRRLKIIAEKCGIEENLTSYVSRHSFATQALFLEVPLMAISQMLGHSKVSTTQIYLKSLPTKTLDDYQRKIIEL